MRTLSELYDMYPDAEFLRMEGFDDAVIGVDERTMRLVYSKSKIMRQLIRSMDYETAMEHFDYNIAGAWVGDDTPIIVNDMFYTSGI
jgi:hypothetical protein